jgi:hypothetical protein
MSANEAQFGFSPSAALGTFALIRLEIVRGYVIVPVAECKTASSGLGKLYLLGRSSS